MNSENPTSAATIPAAPHAVPLALIQDARPAGAGRGTAERVGEPVRLTATDLALPRGELLRAMRHEMRRADRSGSPLSMVVYRISPHDGFAGGTMQQLIETLCLSKRETDLVGCAGPGLVAVVCPDTDQSGGQKFAEKILAQGLAPGITSTVATYPHCVFEELSAAVREADPGQQALQIPFAPEESTGYPLKRLLDIVCASIALVLLSPVMLVVACAIAITSPGPIIFRQIRLGKGGVPFVFFKFRSMHSNSDDRIHRQYVADLIRGQNAAGAEGGAKIYKIRSDPRIFPVGKVIRKTSIDELPQLFNVLRGDMSMVGPRPSLPYEVENYEAWHLRRILAIRPGITGLWQVEGRSRVPFDEMVRMDLRYIRDCSLLFDLSLMLRTFKAVLRCDGAE